MVGVIEERRIDFHLPGKNRPQLHRHLVPGWNFLGSFGELSIAWDNPQLLLTGKNFLTQLVPALIELALVLVAPLFRYVVRGVAGARSEVHAERLVRHQRRLLAPPLDRLVGHVLGEVIALLRGLLRLDRRRTLIDRGIKLVGFTAEE